MKPARFLSAAGSGAAGALKGIRVAAVLHGIWVSAVAAVASGVVLQLAVTLGGLPDVSPVWFEVLGYLSAFAGGLVCAKKASRQGLVHGALVGIALFVIVLTTLGGNTSDIGALARDLLLAGLAGAAGGIIGVSMS